MFIFHISGSAPVVVWGAVQQQEDERDSPVLAGGQQRPQVQERQQEQEIQTMMFWREI